ncbi:MAG: F0F1 ATP synthase subunit beta, partial [Chloroflexota bacterium]
MAEQLVGTIKSITGPVVDFVFSEGGLPEIYDAVTVAVEDDHVETFEVAQHVGDNTVRSVAMGSTDGLKRGMEATSAGAPITVPVGPATLGRLFNVTGATIDNKGDVEAETHYPIHRPAPSFDEQST